MSKTFGQLLGAVILEEREAAGWGQRELADQSFPESDFDRAKSKADSYESFLEGKERRIRELESGQVTRPQARNYMPICQTLNIDRPRINALKREAADAKAQQRAEFNEVIEERGSVDAALSQPEGLSSDELQTFAAQFEIAGAETLSDAELRRQLSLKSQEYRALRAEVEAIDEGLKRLSNLKAAAQEAIARVDLDEVEELLSRVQEVELEEAAKTAELRAENALLRGRVEQAYALLSAAADSFAAVDPLEPARRRVFEYYGTLYNHGLRYGGDGLKRSADLLQPCLSELSEIENAELWGGAQNNLALALQNQGSRTGGQTGADLLAEAVTDYRAALRVFTVADHPEQWAQTQNNLAIALADQGARTGGQAGADLLAEAVTAYRAALRVRTEADRPVDWAQTQNNLAIALRNQGTHTGGQAGADLLAEAVTAYRAALRVRTEEAHPVGWAQTQNNLANALGDQGIRTAGKAGADLMAEAVTAYRAALRVRTEEAHRVQWAETMENIAHTLRDLAKHDTTTDPRQPLQEALTHVTAALRVFDPEHMPYNHEKATRLRDRIQAALDAL